MNDSLISSSIKRGRIRSRLLGAVMGSAGAFGDCVGDLERYPKTPRKSTRQLWAKLFIYKGLSASHLWCSTVVGLALHPRLFRAPNVKRKPQRTRRIAEENAAFPLRSSASSAVSAVRCRPRARRPLLPAARAPSFLRAPGDSDY